MDGEAQYVLAPFVPGNQKKHGKKQVSAPGADLGLSPADFGIHDNLPEGQREELERTVYGDRAAPEEGAGGDASDSYFPTDGYNYDKHLKPLSSSGMFIAAPSGFQPYMKEASGASPEEQAALDALAGEMEGYESANEEWFDDILDKDVPEEVVQEALWGDRPTYTYEPEEDEDAAADEKDAELDALMGEYDDDQLGALDMLEPDEVGGNKELAALDSVLEEHMAMPLIEQDRYREVFNTQSQLVCERTVESLDQPDEEFVVVDQEVAPHFDCESVLSMRSNVSNHPGKVGRPERKPRAPRAEEVPVPEDEEVEFPEIVTLRLKGETPEDRKARKAAVKAHQKVCREQKKQTKGVFKEEKKKAMVRLPAGDIRDGVRVRQL